MEKVEDLLPGISEYVRKTLKKENLSGNAERQRQSFEERLSILQFPPSLPPRPNGLLKKVGSDINDDFLAQQRAFSREHAPADSPCDEYDTVEDSGGRASIEDVNANCDDEQLYEVPMPQDTADELPPWTDDDSGTSYESYDDEGGTVYQNDDFHADNHHDLPLPRVKAKKKKKKGGVNQLSPCSGLPATYRGVLYQKGLLTWARRICLISDGHLMCFKTNRDTKPVQEFSMQGYDVIYIEKEGKYSHVIRFSQPGCETYWFYAENKESAEQWIKHLGVAAAGTDRTSLDGCDQGRDAGDGTSGDVSLQLPPGTPPTSQRSSTANLSSFSSSEGGSGDGVVSAPPPSTLSDADKKKAADDKKKFSLTDLLGTFGKKRGQKLTKKSLTIADIEVDPQAIISGHLNVCRDGCVSGKWERTWCAIKCGTLMCYRDPADDIPDSCLRLSGLVIEAASSLTKRELALRLMHGTIEKLAIEPTDSMEQGRWLSILIKETGYVGQEGPEYNYIDDDDDDRADSTEVYDEVYDLDQKPNGSPAVKYEDMSRGGPPLPEPGVPPLAMQEEVHFYLNESQVEDLMKDGGKSAEAEVDEMFSSVQKRLSLKTDNFPSITANTSPITKKRDSKVLERPKRPGPAAPNQPAQTARPVQRGTRVPLTKSRSASEGSDDVVKSHSGPTINEDEELLRSTQNPILSELRRSKRYSHSASDTEKMETELSSLRRRLAFIRKDRAEARTKKLKATTEEARRKCEAEVASLDKQLEETDSQLAKLQLVVAQEKDAQPVARSSSFRSSMSSTSSRSSTASRSNSFHNSPVSRVRKSSSPTIISSRTSSSSSLERNDSVGSSSPGERRRNLCGDTERTEITRIVATQGPGGGLKSATLASTRVVTKRVVTESKASTLPLSSTLSSSKNSENSDSNETVVKRGATKEAISRWNTTSGTGNTMTVTKTVNGPQSTRKVGAGTAIVGRAINTTHNQKEKTRERRTTKNSTGKSPSKTAQDNEENIESSDQGAHVKARLKLWESIADTTSTC